MEIFNLYKDIQARTNGEIYIGVVGPVRTGKSTFIKRFMDLMVLPNVKNEYEFGRAKDELPQSAGGRTITTTEPKFIPQEAANIYLEDDARTQAKVRLIDCVGYMVEGAAGHIEDAKERMVKTPWFDYEIPFTQAAEIGTKKVINDHSTIGIVITTDGSFSEIDRENYIPAETQTIQELKHQNIDETYYYEMLSELLSEPVRSEYQLMHMLQEMSAMKREYTKVQSAMQSVRFKGYGVVTPERSEIILSEPEIIKHGNKYGVKIKAESPSVHFIKANIETEITPIVGTEEQAEDLMKFISQTKSTSEGIWETNIFGKSIEQLVRDGIANKISMIGDESQMKLQETMQKIVNDSNGGIVCIII